jgi:flagellar biosynthesis/type III secretory pathway M-ring protein FliF/YscJ
MVNEDSAREQLLETIRSIEFQTLVNLVLVVLAAYLLGIIITKVISKISEKMSRRGRIKGKMIIPIIKVGI